MTLSPKAQQTLILVIAVLLVLWYLKGKAGEAARIIRVGGARYGHHILGSTPQLPVLIASFVP